MTNEVYEGTTYSINANFRAYNSIEESISDYFDLITKSERYRKAMIAESQYECIKAIKEGGYATDPEYVNKIMNIINQWNLQEYDKQKQETSEMYIIGKNYELQENMFVRTGGGQKYHIKAWQELTEDGKRHALVQQYGVNAILKKGTIVTCQGIEREGNNIWLKIPSGYVAGYHNGEVFIK